MSAPTDPADAVHIHVEVESRDDAVCIVLRGEADFSDVERFQAVLDRVQLDGSRRVDLDLTELDFADVATLRQLTLFAQRARAAGHNVITRGARSVVRRVAGVLNWDGDLGLA